MKKFIVAAGAALALTLTGCGPSTGASNDGYAPSGGYTEYDYNMNNRSLWNDATYCPDGTYIPLPNAQYQCSFDVDGVTTKSKIKPRPKATIPPKSMLAKPSSVKATGPAKVAPAKPAKAKAPAKSSSWGKPNSSKPQKAPAFKAPAYKAPSAPKFKSR